MKKDAYYFSHDANAQDDPKLMHVIEVMGMEGVGIYWCIIEKLRAEKGYKLPLSTLPFFAKRWHTIPEKVEKVVTEFKLFKIKSEIFFSDRLRKSMEEKTQRAKQSASARWENATAMQPHSNRNATGMRLNAIKGKESKRKKNNTESPFGDEKYNDFSPPKPGMVF